MSTLADQLQASLDLKQKENAAAELEDLAERLAAPFDPSEVHFKPQKIAGNRALAVAYIDARCVMERLDDVFGVGGWQDSYDELDSGSVVCTLRVRVNGSWIEKSDVGSQSEQQDDGDKLKAAFSDALKRAAVKLGIGRYLYRLPKQWADFDPQKREFTSSLRLPDWALPKNSGTLATISQEQAEEIAGLLKQRSIPWEQFAGKFQVERLLQLSSSQFQAAKKFAKNGKAGSATQA